MIRTWWVDRLFGRASRPARPAAKPALVHLEDRTVPAVLTEAGTVLTIDLDAAGEAVGVVSGGANYKFTTTAVFTDGGVTAGNFTGLGTDTVTLDDLTAYTEIRITGGVAGGAVRFDDSGGNVYQQPFTVALTGAGSTVLFAGSSDFGVNRLDVTAAGPVTQTAGSLTAGDFAANGSAVNVTAGLNSFISISGSATAGRFDLTAVGSSIVAPPGVTATGTVNISLDAGSTLSVVAPVTSTAGNVEFEADDVFVAAAVSAPFAGTTIDQGNVYFFTVTAGQGIALAAGVTPGKLSLAATELALLSAGRLVQLGDNLAGDITISQAFTAPPGFTKLVLYSGGNITQAPAAGIVIDSLAVVLDDTGALTPQTAALLSANNSVRTFAAEGDAVDDIAFVSTGPLTIGTVGTVVGFKGRTVTATAGSPLTVAADVVAAGSVTLTAADSAAAGDDLTVNPGVTVRSAGGDVTLNAGDNLVIGAGAVLKSDAGAVLLNIDAGDADPGAGAAADISAAVLFAPLGLTLTGGPDADRFTVAASADAPISVNGSTPSLPTLPGDTLTFVGSGGTVTVTPGVTPDTGTIQDGALNAVTFQEIETLSLNGGAGVLVVNGTNGPDVLVLYVDAGTTFYTLNGSAPVAVVANQFTFNGLVANDTLIVDYKGGDPVPAGGVLFDGTDKAGDILRAVGKAGFSAKYLPDAATTGKGTVTVQAGVISFQNVGDAGNSVGVDVTAFDTATLLTPNANDQLTVANGAEFVTGKIALVVTGASGLTPITPAAFRANGGLVVDTETGSAGADTITVASADGDHQNQDLTFTTGAGADAIDVTGAVAAGGSVVIQSAAVSVFANVTSTGGPVRLVNGGNLLLKAAVVAGDLGVFQLGAGPVLLINDVVLESAAGQVSVASSVDAAPAFSGTLTVSAKSAAGVATLSGAVGTANRPTSLTVNAGKQIALPAASYKTLGDQTYNGPTVVSAAAVGFEAVTGRIQFLGTLDGASAVTVNTPGDTVFGRAVGETTPLAALATIGGGTTFINGPSVRTAGTQSYGDAVVVGADTVLTAGGKIGFDATLDGAKAVTVSAAGPTAFKGAVGGGTPLASLTVNGGSTATFFGGLVKTTAAQIYDDAVLLGAATTFDAGGPLTFNNTVDGAVDATFVSPTTTFNKSVGGGAPLGSVTATGGKTVVNGGSVVTSGKQTYVGPVEVPPAGPTAFTAGGEVRFAQTLTGATASISVTTPGETVFAGNVNVNSLITDPAGTTRVGGVVVAGAAGLTFGDPVVVDASAVFQSSSGNITFGQTLTGATTTATVAAGKSIVFNGAVDVVALTTNTPGGTAVVNTPTVKANAGDLTFNTDVTTAQPAVEFVGKNVTFNGKLTGNAGAGANVTVRTAGTGKFFGAVDVGSLTTDIGGQTELNNISVKTAREQTYNDAFVYTGSTTLAADGPVTFVQTVTGTAGAKLTVTTAADTTFQGAVNASGLTTNGGGRTVISTSSFASAGVVRFDDPVVVTANVTFMTKGSLTFNGTLDGKFDVTVGGAGTTALYAAVGGGQPLASLTIAEAAGLTKVAGGLVQTAGPQSYRSSVTTTRPTSFIAGGTITIGSANAQPAKTTFGGPFDLNLFSTGPAGATAVNQARNSTLTANLLTLNGDGDFLVDSPSNSIASLAATARPGPADSAVRPDRIFVSTSGSLAVAPVGLTADGDIRLRTGGVFVAGGAGSTTPPTLVTTGGKFAAFFGLNGGNAAAEFTAEVQAAAVYIGSPTDRPSEAGFASGLAALLGGLPGPDGKAPDGFAGPNVGENRVTFRPSQTTPFFLFGNRPTPPTDTGADLLDPFLDSAVRDFQFDGQDGLFDVVGRKLVRFFNFEGLGRKSQTAFVVQTGEVGDSFGSITQLYSIRVVQTQSVTLAGTGGEIPVKSKSRQLPAGLDGQRLPENPFVVAPALVNPAAPTQPPRVTFALVDGDTVPDLILANGPGTPPLITIINGTALNQIPDGSGGFRLNRLEELVNKRDANGRPFILAQFYAFEPTFQGGVNVAAADLTGDGRAEIVVTPDSGGGPRVRVLSLVDAAADAPTALVPAENALADFFAYEESFRGGVRVAVGDIAKADGTTGADGVPEIFVVPGTGGGPRVRVFQFAALTPGVARPASFADFLTVEESFRGGLYIDAGRYNPVAGSSIGDEVDDIVVGAASGGGPRVMVFDGRTITRGVPTPTVLANFFAFSRQEINDPFILPDPTRPDLYQSGVGGVTFGERDQQTGYRAIVVSTGRGPKVQVRQLPGRPADLNSPDFDPVLLGIDLIERGTNFPEDGLLEDVPLRGAGNRVLDPKQLNFGATVGSFNDPNS